ncbi:MAG: SMC-Scp complex subunit ScpB [Phycisphaerales bacterium JB040]
MSTDAQVMNPPDTSDPNAGDTPLDATLEAVLLTLDRPTTTESLLDAVSVVHPGLDAEDVENAIARLNADYESTGRAFRIEQVAGGHRLMTLPRHATAVAAYHRSKATTRLSRAALETLSIIAYRQPITRAQLEVIRGVACGEILRTLTERRMVMVKGRAEELGRPMLYGTTRHFLDAFGLASVKDLPNLDDTTPDPS